jgi:5-methylcytosine-specific restriction protein B
MEFGHRVFFEAVRFAAFYESSGTGSINSVLDRIIMQKILPRLHGSRRKLEAPLRTLALLCFKEPEADFPPEQGESFEPDGADPRDAALPISYDKLKRMIKILRANQFAAFAE